MGGPQYDYCTVCWNDMNSYIRGKAKRARSDDDGMKTSGRPWS
jgi:hypothetical protein